ncbi:hypothetical protein PMH75_000725 [Salmonella enterica]|nr:hypothetical protein [Salmonella enterica]EBW9743115.1 hypothetical protein [Salmonella enterica subsp. enterica serovar Saintpaul]EKK2800731.1 hypothetical protein [Salmonella enterica]
MEGFLRGKCLPGDMKVNESNAQYLVRKFSEFESKLSESQREFRAADATIHNLELQLTDMAVQLANAESKCRELAAENTGLNKFIKSDCWIWDDKSEEYFDAADCMPETPATDAFLAEVRASARNEGINYAASRLAAAFNHGFVDKPLAEVCDVVRMILDTKEELANSTPPAVDGISGEYAEKFLAEFAAKLQKGAAL